MSGLRVCKPRVLATFSVVRSLFHRRSYLPEEIEPGSYPFPKRQVPEAGRKSFKERCAELNQPPVMPEWVDIGLPFSAPTLLPNRPQPKHEELESASRKRTLKLSVDTIDSAAEDTQAPVRRLVVAHHFGVFRDLFGPSHFFVPSVHMGIYFAQPTTSDDASSSDAVDVQPVFTGNLISPKNAQMTPIIDLSMAPASHYWTLIMSCPDEPVNFDEEPPPNEYVHWIVTNLSPNSAESGDEVIPYLPPLPYVGTGFHRYIFILYRQENGKLNPQEFLASATDGDYRSSRRFNTSDLYRRLESELTPAGLAFFQSSWDESVRAYFRNVLDCPEPIFELRWPETRPPPQERFPVANTWVRARRHPHGLPLIRERYGAFNDVSFDVYLDRYRDRKELQEELVLERLKQEGNPLDPAEFRRKRPEFPAAVPMPKNMPSWWVKQEMQRRLRTGRWKHLEGHDG